MVAAQHEADSPAQLHNLVVSEEAAAAHIRLDSGRGRAESTDRPDLDYRQSQKLVMAHSFDLVRDMS